MSEYHKRWQELNRKKTRAYSRKYYHANAEKVMEAHRKYRQRKREQEAKKE